MQHTLIRHGPPGKYDHCAYGTLCKTLLVASQYEMYVQISNDESMPVWQSVGVYSPGKEEKLQEEIGKVMR
jgi:hypothetical protein